MIKIYDSMNVYCGYIKPMKDGKWRGYNENKDLSEIYKEKNDAISFVKYGC